MKEFFLPQIDADSSKPYMGKKKFLNRLSNKAPFLKGAFQDSAPRIDDFPPAFSFEKMQDGSDNSFAAMMTTVWHLLVAFSC